MTLSKKAVDSFDLFHFLIDFYIEEKFSGKNLDLFRVDEMSYRQTFLRQCVH